ncbi:unnamed protein product [Microthlaspi erraticum]|uniref:F-box domain-containing protein n=1 Tax=Microthlaspi erraticum TaxID=1685480 RepID=A0A6D2HAD6_9BRAS|nr:unnamed protein product [Microthlaspi erraticum]
MEEGRSLPEDLVEEILSRAPAKSVARWRSTSKQWNVLLECKRFAEKHSANAPKESLIITLAHSRVCLLRINFPNNKDAPPSVNVSAPFNLKDPDLPKSSSQVVGIYNVFDSDDGLLLCTTVDNRLVLWNPCSGETKWIKPRDSYKKSDYYALGYDNKSSCKQYKILRVDRQIILPIKNEYEIYDLTSDSWRVLGVDTDWFLAAHRRGVSVKGITYWVAHESLLSFDFSTEKFQILSLPHPFPHNISALSVVREEQLCLLGHRTLDDDRLLMYEATHPHFQVWVRTSTGSWKRSVAVTRKHERKHGGYFHNFYKGMSFLRDEQNKVVLYLSPDNLLDIVRENKRLKEYHLGGDRKFISSVLLNYVPSMVQIQRGTSLGRKRKRKAQS